MTAAKALAVSRDDAHAQDLQGFLRGLLHSDPIPAQPRPVQRATVRRWNPIEKPQPALLEVVDRHPNFWFGDPDVPVRKLRRLAQAPKMGWRGLFQSVKNNRSMRHHNLSELWALQACEADPAVTEFVEHPACILVRCDGRRRKFRFSTYARRGAEHWFLLGLRESTAANPGNEKYLDAVGRIASAAGFVFEIVTELHRREQPLARSIFDVLRGRQAACATQTQLQFALDLAREGITLATLEDELGLTKPDIFRLMLHRRLFSDLRQPLNSKSLLTSSPILDPVPLWSPR